MAAVFGLMIFMSLGMGIGLCVAATSGTTISSHDNSQLLSISLINQEPDPAMAGDIVDLRFGIENQGGQNAENVMLEIDPQYPFEPISGNSTFIEVGTLSPYQTDSNMQVVKCSLRLNSEATAGNYSLNVLVYENGKQDQFSTQKTFSIPVGGQNSAEIVYINKTELTPGEQTPIQFVLRNVGSSPLRNVVFSWTSSGDIVLPVGSDNTKYMDYLGVGQEVGLDYNVTADAAATAGLYKLNLSLKYDDAITGSTRQTSTVAGMYVGGGTDFDVSFSESSGGQTSFSVANIGSNPAYSVSVAVPRQSGWSVSGSNSEIIGNLNKGDYTVAGFSLSQSGAGQSSNRTGQAGQFQANRTGSAFANSGYLTVDILYTDTRGQRQVAEKNVSMTGLMGNSSYGAGFSSGNGSSRSGQSGRGGMGGLGGLSQGMDGLVTIIEWVVAGIIALAVVYYLYRRRKKNKVTDARRKAMEEDAERLARVKGKK